MTIEATAARADQFAAIKGAPSNIASIANLIRHAKGHTGIKWIIQNCEANASVQAREDHAAMYRVIAKRLTRSIS